MTTFTKILLIWLIFDVIVYLIMWYDTREHNFHIKESIKSIKESFTQDE